MSAVDKELSRLAKTAAAPEAARRLLSIESTSAVALLAAAEVFLGGEFLLWEPETVWLELQHRGVSILPVGRAKLEAVRALLLVPSFYWDAIVFEKTALAFDGHVPNPDALEEATVAQLAWAVKEAAWVATHVGEAAKAFEHEPAAYSAVVMHRDGFILAPEQLAFAQDLLDNVNETDNALKTEVREKWAALDKSTMDVHAFDESFAGVQLARLAAVELHVREREDRAAADLAALR